MLEYRNVACNSPIFSKISNSVNGAHPSVQEVLTPFPIRFSVFGFPKFSRFRTPILSDYFDFTPKIRPNFVSEIEIGFPILNLGKPTIPASRKSDSNSSQECLCGNAPPLQICPSEVFHAHVYEKRLFTFLHSGFVFFFV